MLKHYRITKLPGNETRAIYSYWVGSTEDELFYPVEEHFTFNKAAAFVKSAPITQPFWVTEEELLQKGAEEIAFKKGLVPNGCIS